MKNKYLITSALPYVNGEMHLGHLVGCWLPSDIYARFCRAMGRDVLFVCGADEHGTTAMAGAKAENMDIIDYTNKYFETHLKTVKNFDLSFDIYGRTHTEKHTRLIQGLFTRLEELNLIEERETMQPFSVDDNMFLADRQLVGTCPKCGYDKANGDQCDVCTSTYEADELINPKSTISGSTNIEMRATKNLFFLASKVQTGWKEWLDKKSPGWSKSASAIAKSWAKEGLLDTGITRDISWGIPVNKPGYENKVFYVWFDAPWGYVSMSQEATKDWESWWKNDDCYYAQFMGKDNVKFHAVFFPQQQLALNQGWKTVDMLKGMNFLNYDGGKFSKSQKRGIFLDQAIDIAPSDSWRYSLIASAPETDDTDFTIQRFADIVNKDLNGVLGNFISRVTKLSQKNFGNTVPDKGTFEKHSLDLEVNKKLDELTHALEKCEFRDAVFALRSLWAIGNEFMTQAAPWALIKDGNANQAKAILNECFQLIDLYARVSAPFIPNAAEKIQAVFKDVKNSSWPSKYERRIKDGEEFYIPDNLFNRIEDETIKELEVRFAPIQPGAPKLVVAKITDVQKHPNTPGLNILSIDAGGAPEKPLKIVSGAANAKVGFTGVFAPIGAILPGNKKPLAQRAIKGILSDGMMLSASEMKVGLDSDNLLEASKELEIGSEYKNG